MCHTDLDLGSHDLSYSWRETSIISVKHGLATLAVTMSFAVGIGGTGIANAATIDANDLPAHARVVMTSKSAVVVNGNNITINGVTYTQEEFQKVLDQAILDENGGRKKVHAAFAPAIAAGAGPESGNNTRSGAAQCTFRADPGPCGRPVTGTGGGRAARTAQHG